MVCENCLHRTVCEYSYTMTERYGCIYHSRKESIIIPELEKIKTDLEKLSKNEWNKQVGADKGLELAIDVVEDRISELKGE